MVCIFSLYVVLFYVFYFLNLGLSTKKVKVKIHTFYFFLLLFLLPNQQIFLAPSFSFFSILRDIFLLVDRTIFSFSDFFAGVL